MRCRLTILTLTWLSAVTGIGDTHWSFVPPTTPAIPEVAHSAWHTNAIDKLILTQLEERQLSPAPRADRQTLIRRAYFSAIGLPPTPEEVAAFLNDPADDKDAFATVIEALLASPHYGERWGRHWLDVARYGDSNGGDENHAYPNAYHYRNWVIQALNDDLPYNDFLRHQIAGDLLPEPTHASITATGFLALGTKILAEQDPIKKHSNSASL